MGELAEGKTVCGGNFFAERGVGISRARSIGERVEGTCLGEGTRLDECGAARPDGVENFLGIGVTFRSEHVRIDNLGEEASRGP